MEPAAKKEVFLLQPSELDPIDRATRWVFMRTYRDQSERSSTDFLRRLKQAAPMKIRTILTDNGSQFTDRLTSTSKTPPD